MSTFGRMYRGETHIDFVGNRNRGFPFPAVVVGASLGSLIFLGVNGGTVLPVPPRAERPYI